MKRLILFYAVCAVCSAAGIALTVDAISRIYAPPPPAAALAEPDAGVPGAVLARLDSAEWVELRGLWGAWEREQSPVRLATLQQALAAAAQRHGCTGAASINLDTGEIEAR